MSADQRLPDDPLAELRPAPEVVLELDDVEEPSRLACQAVRAVESLNLGEAPGLDYLVLAIENATRAQYPSDPSGVLARPPKLLETASPADFERGLHGLWLATQPIVSWSQRATVGWEALLRSRDPRWAGPLAVFSTAEQLERVGDVSRRVRGLAVDIIHRMPPRARLWVNLHPSDLEDDHLYARHSPLSQVAERVVLEINENAQLERYADLKDRIQRLRELGYLIAVDDLGAGYATLRSVAQLVPDIVKVDMNLIRNVDRDPMKGRVIGSLVTLCDQLGVVVIVEGVETPGELSAAIGMGCNLFQGYLFGRAEPDLRVGQAHLSFEEQHEASPLEPGPDRPPRDAGIDPTQGR